ncbi:MFS general substrate transporter [Penicillium cinerascens]|uniref:MFS general substrate transporter n=1 Tax=Penicillium cinerascens TaxID=70096 RepID=A0A9W9JLV4_9EURO|nr:MFS general substrate transporter [Penicillium cinerascens]KAJ5198724.1 MFS general substrate transporter [Penicillium cinerascens]
MEIPWLRSSIVGKWDFYELLLLLLVRAPHPNRKTLDWCIHMNFLDCMDWNLLIKRYSGQLMFSLSELSKYGFGSLLAIQIILGVFETGSFIGGTVHITTFYRRDGMGLCLALAIRHSFAVFALPFSWMISYGVLQIKDTAIKGWQ